MPIASPRPKKPSTPLPTPPLIKSEKVRNEVVNAEYVPLKGLITHVAGKSWLATYFNQILGPSSEPMPPQLDSAATLQQYRRIRKFTLKVQTDLQRNPKPEEGEMEITGNAHVLPGVVPQYGDAFYADIGDGNVGLFVVTNAEPTSNYNDTAYYIEYGLLDYLRTDIEAKMTARVVEDTIYDMDYVNTGKNPILAYDEYFTRERLANEEQSLIDHFFSQFFDKNVATFTLPGQDNLRTTYDPFHVRFVDRLIEHPKRPSRFRLTVLDETLGENAPPVTLWDMFVKQDVRQFSYVAKDMQLLPARYFRGGSVLMQGIAYSGVDDVVYPVKHNTPQLHNDLLGDANTNGDVDGVLFRELHVKDYYLFSEAFYHQRRHEMNMLEREVHNLITQQPISVDNVDTMINAYYGAPPLVQYYAFPMLVALCRAASQGVA